MKVLIELPTWLGDTIMATPAIENIRKHFGKVEITLVGSLISIEALKYHPEVTKTYVLEKNYIQAYNTLKYLDAFDLFVSFRSSFRSKFNKFCVTAKKKYQYDKNKYQKGHQVEKYNDFINASLKSNNSACGLKLYGENQMIGKKNKLLGINPGSTYGSSKRWYPNEFANVARELAGQYDIIIFGGPGEKDIAQDIENFLIEKGVKNYLNRAALTTIDELIAQISNLDLFITGDSGPMHIAAVFQIPTVSIFGSTNDKETSQWMNPKSFIIKKNLECQPCMKRVCPLKHHNCMKLIDASDVMEAVKTMKL